jgi:integrase
MATIKFLLRSKGENCNIYVRLSIDRNNVYKRKTNYIIDSNDWKYDINYDKQGIKKTFQTGIPKQSNEKLKELKTNLDKLKTEIEERFNEATTKGILISGDWLNEQINDFQNKPKKEEPDRLINHFQFYIDNLPTKRTGKQKEKVKQSTITKYSTIRNKLVEFEKYKRKKILVKNVDLKFRTELINYFKDVEALSSNTIGRYITFIKTVCNDAKIYGIETHPQLEAFKGYTDKAEKVFLSFAELEKIENVKFTREALDNAKDWLIIGCYIGQRVSDVLTLTKDNIITKNGLDLISLTQQKTNKNIVIPIPPKVKEILTKRNGEFPRFLSAVNFNKHIKDVAKLAEINELTEGAKLKEIEENKYRKIHGTYEKWELITSHVMRRSFATNFYGEMPTALIISITGHSTEAQYLEYVGKPALDNAQIIAEYWTSLYAKQQNKKVLLRKVN